MARLPFWSQFFLTLALLFWNQIFSWDSERPSSLQRFFLLSSVKYWLAVNSLCSLSSWSELKAVLCFFSALLSAVSAFLLPCFLFLPPEGLSEYLVAKTQAGMLERSTLLEMLGVLVVWLRSIGSSGSFLIVTFAGDSRPKSGRRMLSMENERLEEDELPEENEEDEMFESGDPQLL